MSPTSNQLEHVVDANDAGERADVVLGRRIPGLSRRLARSLALAGRLRVDDRKAPPSQRVEAGQRLSLTLPEPSATPELELEVLTCSERFVYVHKPAGVHTVARVPDEPGTLAHALAQRHPECASASEDPREAGAIHRLDRPTSGVVAFARTRAIWQQARAGMSSASAGLVKHYLAVGEWTAEPTWPPECPPGGLGAWIEAAPPPPALPIVDELATGPLECVRVRAPLGRAPEPGKVAVRLDGQRAATLIQPLARADRRWLVRLSLETGRRHQARVHMAWIGMPIVGDTDYAAPSLAEVERPRAAPARILLHALALDLSPLFPGEPLVIAPPAIDFWPGPAVLS